MPLADWTVPMTLTTPYGDVLLNTTLPSGGAYLLRADGCKMGCQVRSTKTDVPQSDGSILHTRFLSGMDVLLAIQLWDMQQSLPACSDLLQTMLDDLVGGLRSLLNAGDNEGRLAWLPAGLSDRMVDDVRLLVYPVEQIVDTSAGLELQVVLDSRYPYAQDLMQTSTGCADGVAETLVNSGSASYFPVFKVNQLNGVVSAAAVSSFTITVTQGADVTQFVYNDGFPGAVPISAGGHYAEIDTFGNTIYLNGSGANLKAGVDELNSEYMAFPAGTFDVQIDGCDMDVLWAPAWG